MYNAHTKLKKAHAHAGAKYAHQHTHAPTHDWTYKRITCCDADAVAHTLQNTRPSTHTTTWGRARNRMRTRHATHTTRRLLRNDRNFRPYLPATQLLQGEVAPDENCPAAHTAHTPCPLADVKRPAGHVWQGVVPPVDAEPAEQAPHSPGDTPVWPAGQAVHAAAPAAEDVPRAQVRQGPVALPAYSPARQNWQADCSTSNGKREDSQHKERQGVGNN